MQQLQPAYRTVAKMPVDALYDLRFQMLKLRCHAAGNANVEHAADAFARRKDKLLRLRVSGQFAANNRRPLGNDARFREASSAEDRSRQFRHQSR